MAAPAGARTIIVATAALTAGCSSNGAQTPAAEATNSSPATATVADASPGAEVVDAGAVLAELIAAGLPITDSAVVTESNDANNLIGRPGQHTSKVAFADGRVGTPIDQAAPGNEAGGSIEVFADDADAQARSDYIQQTLQRLGPIAGTEYHYLSGPVLVRVDGELVPSTAAGYEAAVAALS